MIREHYDYSTARYKVAFGYERSNASRISAIKAFFGLQDPVKRKEFEKELSILIKAKQYIGKACTKNINGEWICYIVRDYMETDHNASEAAKRLNKWEQLCFDAIKHYEDSFGVKLPKESVYVQWQLRCALRIDGFSQQTYLPLR